MLRTLALLLLLCAALPAGAQSTSPPPATKAPPATAPETATPPAPPALTGAPEGLSLVDKSIEAVGGKAAFEAIQSKRLRLTITSGRAPQELVLLSSGKEKVLVTVPIPQIGGEMKMGRNGQFAWREIPGAGLQRATTKEIDQIGQFASVPTIVWSLRDRFERFITVGEEKVGEDDAWRIHVSVPRDRTSADQSVESHLILRKSDLLPLAVERVISGQAARSAFSGWKKFDAIMIPTRMDVRAGTQAQSIEIVEASFNQVDDSVFTVPDGIKESPPAPAGG